MKKYTLLVTLMAACSDYVPVGDFRLISPDPDSWVDTCFLSQPGTAVFVLEVTKSWGQETDPSCDAVDPFRWTAYTGVTGKVRASTPGGPAEESTIDVFDPIFNIGGGEEFLIQGQKINGRWIARTAFAIDTEKTSTTDHPSFPTNWLELEGDIKATQSKFDTACPPRDPPRVTASEFAEYSKPIVPNYLDRPQCDPIYMPMVECTEANGCLPDDGDDSN